MSISRNQVYQGSSRWSRAGFVLRWWRRCSLEDTPTCFACGAELCAGCSVVVELADEGGDDVTVGPWE